jgi:hypothetical protein
MTILITIIITITISGIFSDKQYYNKPISSIGRHRYGGQAVFGRRVGICVEPLMVTDVFFQWQSPHCGVLEEAIISPFPVSSQSLLILNLPAIG